MDSSDRTVPPSFSLWNLVAVKLLSENLLLSLYKINKSTVPIKNEILVACNVVEVGVVIMSILMCLM